MNVAQVDLAGVLKRRRGTCGVIKTKGHQKYFFLSFKKKGNETIKKVNIMII